VSTAKISSMFTLPTTHTRATRLTLARARAELI
jgi:hypothetical protein